VSAYRCQPLGDLCLADCAQTVRRAAIPYQRHRPCAQDVWLRPELLGSGPDLSNGLAGAHGVDVLLSGAVTADDVDEGPDICTTGSPAFQDVVGDGRDYDATLLGAKPGQEVRPALQPRRATGIAHSHDFTFPLCPRVIVNNFAMSRMSQPADVPGG
jgi:hypothetical protein